MADVFSRAGRVITTSDTEIFACPSDKTVIVTALSFVNVTGSTVTMDLYARLSDGVGGHSDFKLADDQQLATKVGWSPISEIGKIVLGEGDSLRAISSGANSVDAYIGVLISDV